MMKNKINIKNVIISTTMLSGATFIFKGLYKLNEIKNSDLFEGGIEADDRSYIMYNHDKTKPISKTNTMIDNIVSKRRSETIKRVMSCSNASDSIMFGTALISTSLGVLALKGIDTMANEEITELPGMELLKEELLSDEE